MLEFRWCYFVVFSEECVSRSTFPGWFFSRIFFKFPFIECGMAPSAAPTMTGIVSIFTFPSSWLLQPFVCFFVRLLFFSAGYFFTDTSIRFHHFSTVCLRMISGLLAAHSSVSVDLLIIQYCAWSYCRNRAWNVVVPLFG